MIGSTIVFHLSFCLFLNCARLFVLFFVFVFFFLSVFECFTLWRSAPSSFSQGPATLIKVYPARSTRPKRYFLFSLGAWPNADTGWKRQYTMRHVNHWAARFIGQDSDARLVYIYAFHRRSLFFCFSIILHLMVYPWCSGIFRYALNSWATAFSI